MLSSSFAEIFSLASVVPFLTVLSNPQKIWSIEIVRNIALNLGLNNESNLMLFTTIIFIGSAITASLIRLRNLWVNNYLAACIVYDLSCEAYRRTLHQPYSVHIARNSSSLIKTTTMQIQLTVACIEQVLNLFTAILIATGLLATLLYIDSTLALITFIVFGLAYFVLAKTAKNRLISNSRLVNKTSEKQIQTLQEGLGSIRNVLLDSRQDWYVKKYSEVDWSMRITQANSSFLAAFPRYIMEGLGLILIAFLGYALTLTNGSMEVIPLLGTIALGAQKLLPVSQQAYNAWARIRSCHSAIESVINMVNQSVSIDNLNNNLNLNKVLNL